MDSKKRYTDILNIVKLCSANPEGRRQLSNYVKHKKDPRIGKRTGKVVPFTRDLEKLFQLSEDSSDASVENDVDSVPPVSTDTEVPVSVATPLFQAVSEKSSKKATGNDKKKIQMVENLFQDSDSSPEDQEVVSAAHSINGNESKSSMPVKEKSIMQLTTSVNDMAVDGTVNGSFTITSIQSTINSNMTDKISSKPLKKRLTFSEGHWPSAYLGDNTARGPISTTKPRKKSSQVAVEDADATDKLPAPRRRSNVRKSDTDKKIVETFDEDESSSCSEDDFVVDVISKEESDNFKKVLDRANSTVDASKRKSRSRKVSSLESSDEDVATTARKKRPSTVKRTGLKISATKEDTNKKSASKLTDPQRKARPSTDSKNQARNQTESDHDVIQEDESRHNDDESHPTVTASVHVEESSTVKRKKLARKAQPIVEVEQMNEVAHQTEKAVIRTKEKLGKNPQLKLMDLGEHQETDDYQDKKSTGRKLEPAHSVLRRSQASRNLSTTKLFSSEAAKLKSRKSAGPARDLAANYDRTSPNGNDTRVHTGDVSGVGNLHSDSDKDSVSLSRDLPRRAKKRNVVDSPERTDTRRSNSAKQKPKTNAEASRSAKSMRNRPSEKSSASDKSRAQHKSERVPSRKKKAKLSEPPKVSGADSSQSLRNWLSTEGNDVTDRSRQINPAPSESFKKPERKSKKEKQRNRRSTKDKDAHAQKETADPAPCRPQFNPFDTPSGAPLETLLASGPIKHRTVFVNDETSQDDGAMSDADQPEFPAVDQSSIAKQHDNSPSNRKSKMFATVSSSTPRPAKRKSTTENREEFIDLEESSSPSLLQESLRAYGEKNGPAFVEDDPNDVSVAPRNHVEVQPPKRKKKKAKSEKLKTDSGATSARNKTRSRKPRSKSRMNFEAWKKLTFDEKCARSSPLRLIRPTSPDQAGVRRSSRVRTRPLDRWLGEQLIYDEDDNLVGVTNNRLTEKTTIIKQVASNNGKNNKSSKTSKRSRKKKETQPNVKDLDKKNKNVKATESPPPQDVHDAYEPEAQEAMKSYDSPELPELPEISDKNKKSSRFKPGSLSERRRKIVDVEDEGEMVKVAMCDLVYIPTDQVTGMSKRRGVSAFKGLTNKIFAMGFMTIDGGTSKEFSVNRSESLCFLVIEGDLEFTIVNQSTIVCKDGCFFVPRGNGYSITNLRDEPARLVFTQVKVTARTF